MEYDKKEIIFSESGAIESALCKILANPVCENLGIVLIGRSITIESSKEEEIVCGRNIGNQFYTDF